MVNLPSTEQITQDSLFRAEYVTVLLRNEFVTSFNSICGGFDIFYFEVVERFLNTGFPRMDCSFVVILWIVGHC